ncbi:hypothetical protein MGN70_013467 [Eutypa lata]|nr:hypothetical protein MGN70_013467 [Eutypa lata]
MACLGQWCRRPRRRDPHAGGSGRGNTARPLPVRQRSALAAVDPDIPDWTPGHLLMDAAFHTQLNILALTDNTRPQLTIVEVVGEGEATRVKRWGNSIELERSPYSAKFTPDGRHVLSNAIYTGLGPEAPRGTISSIRLGFRGGQQSTSCPDGHWAVTANLERSTPALDSPSQGFFSSLSLLRVDAETGHLATVGTYASDGILPEGLVFDGSSRFVAATTFDRYDGRSPARSVNF